MIPPSSTERLHQAHAGPKRLRIVPGAGHGGAAGEDPDRYRDEARAFFLEAIR